MPDPAWTDLGAAIGLGLATVIHPCPATTNLAALAALAGWGGSLRRNLAVSACYVGGQMASLTALGALVAGSSLALPSVAAGIGHAVGLYLGPMLILVGMFHARLLTIPPGWSLAGPLGRLIGSPSGGCLGAAVLGALLALAFCPTTALVFFSLLVPLVIRAGQPLLLPAVYALGAALPVAVTAVVIARSLALGERLKRSPGRLVAIVSQAAGWILIAAGVIIAVRTLFL